VNRFDEALKMLEQGKAVRDIARELDVTTGYLHRELKKHRALMANRCPCCGQSLPRQSLPTP
jgi:hypothetical protein